jgi:hypothetical protein
MGKNMEKANTSSLKDILMKVFLSMINLTEKAI